MRWIEKKCLSLHRVSSEHNFLIAHSPHELRPQKVNEQYYHLEACS